MRRNHAFTLIELLVVIAIIAILASILFPVFAQAKAAAKKSLALTHAKEQGLSTMIYTTDSDDVYPLWFYNNTYRVWSVGASGPDANVHYLLYPYQKDTKFWADPMDGVSEKERDEVENTYKSSSAPAGYQQLQLVYNLGMKTDYGLNCQFIHPVSIENGKDVHHAISQTRIANVAKTIYSISSVWNRTSSGSPYGGGNYELDAPCFFDINLNDLRPEMANKSYWWYGGWNPSRPLAWNVFGGVWPWHNTGTQVIVIYADGHGKSRMMNSIAAGCNVKDGSKGTAWDLDKYEWDITQ